MWLPQDRRSAWWGKALWASGVLAIGLTFRAFRHPESSLSHSLRVTLSTAEADREILSAKITLQSHPEDFDAFSHLAIAYYHKGPESYIDALNALNKARELGATNENLFYYAGVIDDALGLPDYAINELTKYLRHHPGDYETSVRLANLYFHEKRYDEAQGMYRQAIQQWPKDPTVWYNFAMVNKEKGQLDEALSDLNQVQKIAGILPEGGLFQEGEIWRLKGSDDNAISFYKQELSRKTDYLPALEALEAAQRRKGDTKAARFLHKRILDLKEANMNSPTPA